MLLSPKADTMFSLNCWRDGEDSPVLGLCHPRIAGTVEVHRSYPDNTSPACSGNAGTTKKRCYESYVRDANERTTYQSEEEEEENDDDASYGMSYIKSQSVASPLPLRTSLVIVRLPTARVLYFEEEEGEREDVPISETQDHSLPPFW
jgi:hypothetical protein